MECLFFVLFCILFYFDFKYLYPPPYQLMAEERGLVVDTEGFNTAMDEAKERSRNAQNKVCFSLLFIF